MAEPTIDELASAIAHEAMGVEPPPPRWGAQGTSSVWYVMDEAGHMCDLPDGADPAEPRHAAELRAAFYSGRVGQVCDRLGVGLDVRTRAGRLVRQRCGARVF